MYSILATDHDSFFELPFLFQREAGRSINFSMEFPPPSDYSSYPACEPAAPTELLPVVSSTVAPPTFVRWPPWPPHYDRGGISTGDIWAAWAAGEHDAALNLEQEAVAIGDPTFIVAKYWPDFAELREDSRFQQILLDRHSLREAGA